METETNVTCTLTPDNAKVEKLNHTGPSSVWTYASEPDDAGESDHPLLFGAVSPEMTELCWAEFGASPAPLVTERGDRSPLPMPNLSSGTGGVTQDLCYVHTETDCHGGWRPITHVRV